VPIMCILHVIEIFEMTDVASILKSHCVALVRSKNIQLIAILSCVLIGHDSTKNNILLRSRGI